ncbi:MAG TPA: hypothetical protein VK324_14985, partial [Tepidisphaeraceae bacterium]|nr:hypothetical protein [Tepidisphaeraceae bacterium]
MQRVWEIFFGLQRGFLSREGELSLQFNPRWPGQEVIGAATWNALLVGLAALLVIYVYRREGRPTRTRVALGAIRFALLLLVIALLNRPMLTLVQSRTEPSVLAVMIDDSVSMRVADAGATPGDPRSRLEAAVGLLADTDRALLTKLATTHEVRLYRFARDAQPVAATPAPTRRQTDAAAVGAAATALVALTPTGDATAVPASLNTVLRDLQGQRLAGVVVLTDGRDTPARPLSEALAAIKSYGAKVFPVAVGTDASPKNVQIESVAAQDTTFKGDILNVRATVRGAGFAAGHEIELTLKDRKSGEPLTGEDGRPVRTIATLDGTGAAVEAELQAKPEQVGTLDAVVEARHEPGEIDDEDNSRSLQVAVLDTKINLLYVDGYPRWEYRYLKNEMIRDKTVDISVLLTSADATFAQEGDRPVTRFPDSIGEMLDYDVVLIGDVDPREFTDAQLQLVADFVATRGGGFGMVAGPRFAPHAYRGTPIEPLLPVAIARTAADETATPITEGFRPVVTREGEATGVFRFFADRAQNEGFLRDAIQPLFWYARGATAKPGVGEVLAEHPADVGPDGRKAPILVLGRYGAGRTLFSAIDDSWRWRYYTGESVFDTYWVQQVR